MFSRIATTVIVSAAILSGPAAVYADDESKMTVTGPDQKPKSIIIVTIDRNDSAFPSSQLPLTQLPQSQLPQSSLPQSTLFAVER